MRYFFLPSFTMAVLFVFRLANAQDFSKDSLFEHFVFKISKELNNDDANAWSAVYTIPQDLRSGIIAASDSIFSLGNLNSKVKSNKIAYASVLEKNIRRTLLNNNEYKNLLSPNDKNDRILQFHADIKIHKNGSLTVTENIKVINFSGQGDYFNDQLQRGITRDFPTVYELKNGLKVSVPFKFISALRNGEQEAYHSESLRNGIRFYFGRSEIILPNGIYSYTLKYETAKQLLFHTNKTELYWNVNGTGWSFTTDKVSATVYFPSGSSIIEQDCYTGSYGSTDKNCTYKKINDSTIHFSTAQRLDTYQGLTIATAIQPGTIISDNQNNDLVYLYKENTFLFWICVSALLFFIIHFIHWWRVGRDPKKGIIIPQLEPPPGMSAADCGYVLKQQYNSKIFAATLVDLAVKRFIDIQITQEGSLFKNTVYWFKKPQSANPDKEFQVYEYYGFWPEKLHHMQIKKGSYNSEFASVYSSLHSRLKQRLKKGFKLQISQKPLFSLNDGYIGIGILYIIALIIACIIYGGVYHMTWLYYAVFIGCVACCIVTQIIFMAIISSYSKEGRSIADHIEGFKLYLKTAEEKLYNFHMPVKKDLNHFEEYLPYAIALGVENEWNEKFKEQIELAYQNGNTPSYYKSSISSNSFRSSAFASGLSSGLSSTISSASTAPSSSSGGSSGGGFSGGGGGGGGGGGW